MGVLRGQKLKNLGKLPTGWTDRRQIWHTYNADSSGHELRLKKNGGVYVVKNPGLGNVAKTAGLTAGCCMSVPVSHTINNFLVFIVKCFGIPVVANVPFSTYSWVEHSIVLTFRVYHKIYI